MPDPARLNKAIAEEVRSLLARRRVSQKALQEDLGWSRARTNRLVHAEQNWGPAELLALCDYLDVDLAALLAAAKTSAAAQEGGAKQALESMLTQQERAEIDAAREQLRPAKEQPSEDEQGHHPKAQ